MCGCRVLKAVDDCEPCATSKGVHHLYLRPPYKQTEVGPERH